VRNILKAESELILGPTPPPATDTRVEKGDPLVRVGQGARRLTVAAPIAGRITTVNHAVAGETDWSGLDTDDGGAWLYRVTPVAVAQEVSGWMIADRAVTWTQRQLQQLRENLSSSAAGREVGVTMADGGDVPTGVLSRLDDRAWDDFQSAFLHR